LCSGGVIPEEAVVAMIEVGTAPVALPLRGRRAID
jgi:hypothetical protein